MSWFWSSRENKLVDAQARAYQKQAYRNAQLQYNLYCNQKEDKMTREEAITLCKDVAHKSPSDHMIVLNILEALGLIKFDEPESSLALVIDNARNCCYGSSKDQSQFITYLNSHGYKVAKI